MKPDAAMRLALAQARRSSGRTWPNPPVGAIVVRGDSVLGRGRTQVPPGAHAEVRALDAALRREGPRRVRGATLAVTLEPCAHTGRTGPCVERILAAGIARVWVGHIDPNPNVAGKALRRLRRAGVRVEVGVLEDECRAQHRGFVHHIERGRPFVALKLAATLDGRIATRTGESRWITGESSRRAVQRLRSRTDAIVIGGRTAREDDPELVSRRGERVLHRPIRVIFDSQLRVSPRSRLIERHPETTWLVCARSAPVARRRVLEARGARILPVAMRGGRLDPARVLATLAREGLTEVLVEGGGDLAASLLRARLVDELHWFVAPRWIGSEGRAALGELAIEKLAHAGELETLEVRRAGRDLHLYGRVLSKEEVR